MRKVIISMSLISILLGSCTMTTKLHNKKITYNDKKQTYEYKLSKKRSLPLQNEQSQLIDTTNIQAFRSRLKQNKNLYDINKAYEKSGVLKKTDFELAVLYRNANRDIIAGEYKEALNELNKSKSLYTDIDRFSDYSFLKAYAFDKSGVSDSAEFNYKAFLSYSSQKYSARFRGYQNFDINDSSYIAERNYAGDYLSGKSLMQKPHFSIINPKYYYGSFQPGYSYNSGDNPDYTVATVMFLFGTDFTETISFGAQAYFKLYKQVSINPKFVISPNITEYSLATPIQVYKSESNHIGIKFTPFINYFKIDSLINQNTEYYVGDKFINFGARVSAGYYFANHFSVGAYYQYNFFNEQHTFLIDNLFEIWRNNEYDLSVYYNIIKGVSLKAGLKNNDIVAGLFLSGWEISYNFTNPGILLGVDMY